MQVIISGKVVGYDVSGNSEKVIVLLHGWGANRLTLKPVEQLLSRSYRVVNVDVPGFGESEAPVTPWGLDDYVEWLALLLSKLGVTRVYGLVGHSNGGAIALKYAGRDAQLEKLVLLAASGVRSREQGRKLVHKTIARTGKVAMRIFPSKIQSTVKKKWYKKIGSEMLDVPGMEETFKKVTSEDLLIDAGMVSTPTLLIYGSEDMATPVTHGEAYGRVMKNSKLKIIEGAGHYTYLDKPQEVLPLIWDFLS